MEFRQLVIPNKLCKYNFFKVKTKFENESEEKKLWGLRKLLSLAILAHLNPIIRPNR